MRKRHFGGSKSRNKYGNCKTTIDGYTFDSRKEARRYLTLKHMQEEGKITDLTLQAKFQVLDPFIKFGKKVGGISYIADFAYIDAESGRLTVEDVKGFKTDVYKLKRKLFESRYREVVFLET